MAATRGATRTFLRLGGVARLVGISHNRRLVAAAVPAFLKVNNRRRFLDISALPVNKYDLKGVGILTTTSPAFSTESFETLTDQASSDEVEEDSESGMERKWPSPITQVVRHTAFVGGYALNLNELSSVLSSQFGNVKSIFVPKQRISINETGAESKYQYVFVDFDEKSSLQKALQMGQIVQDDGKVIEIKERAKSKRQLELDRTYTVTNLPDDVTIDQIHNYFKAFGNIEVLNLVIKPAQGEESDNPRCVAFIVFQQDSDIKFITTMQHVLNGKTIAVNKASKNTKQQRRDRAKKVLVEGLLENSSEDEVKAFFDSIAPTKSIFSLKDLQTGKHNGITLIEFETPEGAVLAAKKQFQTMKGCKIQVRRLGVCNQ